MPLSYRFFIKSLLSFIGLIAFYSSSYSQQVALKSGTYNLAEYQVTDAQASEEYIAFNQTLYGVYDTKNNQPLPTNTSVVGWLTPELCLLYSTSSALPATGQFYHLPANLKIDPFLLENLTISDSISVIVNLYQQDEAIRTALASLGELGEFYPLNNSIELTIASTSLTDLAALPFIYWIELPAPALETNNLRERTNHRVPLLTNFSATHQLTGKGVVMGEWDGGGADDHIDYDYRHTRIDNFINNNNGRHATHVAGTMLGAGIKDPVAMGMAPEATFYSYDFYGSVTSEMDDACSKYDIEFTQNSYSYGSNGDPCSRRGTYDNTSVALDRLVRKYPNLLHVFAAGNSRSSNCNGGGYGTVHSGYQASKNAIAVAAITFTDGNSSFHCYGPLRDGRLKPEISAVGVSVNSTFPDNTYRGGYSGTSMACPGTSGTAALITQLYKEKYNRKPEAHLIKGALCNGADELGRSGPDYQFGFGRLNGYNAATIIDNENFVIDSVNLNGTVSDTIFIDNPHQFKIMLCYDDIQGTASSSRALVNDLDLTLVDDAGNTFQPWVLDPNAPTALATRGRDNLNNIEQITINTPSSKYFIYTVRGQSINSGYQRFSVNWLEQDTTIRIVYPNGGEKWLPPSSNALRQTIRWDAYGISGTGVLSYSTDSGTTWNTISNSVNLSRGYFHWQNCPSSVATGQALIKIEKGSYSDVSNAVFDIFQTGPTVASVTPCSEQLHITWNAIPNAVGYHVYMNVDGKMKDLGYTENQFFTIRELDNAKSYWIALSAVAANGAEGPRSIAEEFSPNANTIPPRFPTSPNSRNACAGSNVFFLSTVTGQNLTMQNWQVSTDNGATWTTIPGATGSIFTVNNVTLNEDGNLYRYTAQNNCLSLESSNSALLKIDTILPFHYQDTSIELCVGQSTTLQLLQDGNNTNTIDWYFTDETGDKLVRANTTVTYPLNNVGSHQSGKYYGVVKNSCGNQQNAKRITIEVSDTLKLSFLGDDSLCLGQPVFNQAIATGGRPENYDFFWKFGSELLIQNEFLNRTIDSAETWISGVYDNCSEDTVYEERTFVFRTLPEISISEDTTVCKGSEATIRLRVAGGPKEYYGYLWTNLTTNTPIINNAATLSVYPTFSTDYKVVLVDSCSKAVDSTTVRVTVLDELRVSILSTKDTLCNGELHTLELIGSGGIPNQYRFVWDDGTMSNSRTISANDDTTFSVSLFDNCSAQAGTDSITINVRQPLAILIAGPDTICLGEQVQYVASPSGGLVSSYGYDWTGSADASISFQGNSDTLLTLGLSDGCTPVSAQTTKMVFVREALNLTSTASNITACDGEEISLSVTPTGGNAQQYEIEWGSAQLGSTTENHQFYGDTTLLVKLSDGCSEKAATFSFDISVLAPLELIPTEDIRSCKYESQSITLTGRGGKPGDYRYYANEVILAGNTIEDQYTDSTFYVIRLTDNCTETDAIDSFWIDVRPIDPIIFDIQLENLVVKAKTRLDVSENYWGTDENNFSFFTDTTAELNYTQYGDAQICLQKVDDFGCMDTNCIDLFLFDVFKTNDFTIDLYPNPTSNKLYLSLDKISGKVNIDLISSEGKSVWEQSYTTFNQADFEFDLSDLAPGIYLLEIETNGELHYKKVLVE